MFAAILVLILTVSTVTAGGLSQNPNAVAFLGSYEGTILASGHQRNWELTLSAVDDSGKVKVSRFWQSAVGRIPAEDIATSVEAIFQENGAYILLEVPGRVKMKLTREGDGLLAELLSSYIGNKTIHLKRKL